MSAGETKAALWIGRLGFAARGLIFGLIGFLAFQALLGAHHPQGFDGALIEIARAPYGELLLGAVAVGLILFGVYSVLTARWHNSGRSPGA